MRATAFNKRIYTLRTFVSGIKDVLGHMDEVRTAIRGGRVSRAFAEKIMLTVTRVNGCRYCSFAHTHAALAAGVSHNELQKLMEGEFSTFPDDEVVALTFAQHYAESNFQPDPQAWQRLVDYYGSQTARDILAYLRLITFANLFGNTFDALLSRCAGKPAADSSLINELCVVMGSLIIIPACMLIRIITRLLTRRVPDPIKL
jgi:AhpD family alkylhydroperoxidase